MNINIRLRTIYVLLINLIIIMILLRINNYLNSNQFGNGENSLTVNSSIIQVKDFEITSDSVLLNTSACGAIFVMGTDDVPEHMKIVACVEVDQNDWAGVTFYIPREWEISKIYSSYPQKTEANPTDYVSTWRTTSDKYRWRSFVQVGSNSNYNPSDGSMGTIVIDLEPRSNNVQIDELSNITIAVGSENRNGKLISGTDQISITIP